ncbi:MAG: molybdenum cofactor biosynthesis protein [Alphaproteobacteria bacterium]|jgi:cyclic pyranopterin phosphate synthase|nr:molybdenum cofactor biosynthesis protein [Alphaproteobacteria bacterium]
MAKPGLTHIDPKGNARMVDVGDKVETKRVAIATGCVFMAPATLKMIAAHKAKKGDVLGVAQLAGIMAAKQTGHLIPLCHPLGLDSVQVELAVNAKKACVDITATCKLTGKTGIEMEALTAVSVAALTVYDMVKAVDKDMTIGEIMLVHKSGGKSGTYNRKR